MVSSCAVPFCTNRYSKGSKIRLYRLPLRKRKLLKAWLARIGCESIPLPVMKTQESAANIMKERQKKERTLYRLFLLGRRRRRREPFENLKAVEMNNRVRLNHNSADYR